MTCYTCGSAGSLYRVMRGTLPSGRRFTAPVYWCEKCGKYELKCSDGVARKVPVCIWKGRMTFS